MSACCASLLGASCLSMLAGSHLTDGLLSSFLLELVWREEIQSFPSSGLDTPCGFRVSPAESYSLLMGACPGVGGEWACYHDRGNYYWAFVSGKKEGEAGLYAVRCGVAVNGMTGVVEVQSAVERSNGSDLFARLGFKALRMADKIDRRSFFLYVLYPV